MNARESVLSVLLLLIFPFGLASGSICPNPPTVARAMKDAKIVFAGRVITRLRYGVRFRIEKSWKGISSRYIYVYTGNIRNDAVPWFEKGQQWLVYASRVPLYRTENSETPYNTRLMVRPCNRTVLLRDAGEDLRQLGQGKQPLRARRQ